MLKVRVENMRSSNGNDVPNQFIIETGEGVYFQSYATVIACKVGGRVYLDPRWDYSKTTTKYLNMFLGTESKREIESMLKSGRYVIENLD